MSPDNILGSGKSGDDFVRDIYDRTWPYKPTIVHMSRLNDQDALWVGPVRVEIPSPFDLVAKSWESLYDLLLTRVAEAWYAHPKTLVPDNVHLGEN